MNKNILRKSSFFGLGFASRTSMEAQPYGFATMAISTVTAFLVSTASFYLIYTIISHFSTNPEDQ